MTTSELPEWRRELGELPEPRVRLPGQAKTAHPMTIALNRLPAAYKQKAKGILKKVLIAAEGRLDEVAATLGCSWHVAQRLVTTADLKDFAGELRFKHGHRGPTGLGIQPRPKRKP